MASSRAVPAIVQLVIFYLVISWLVRLARRRKQQMQTRTPGRDVRSDASSSASPEPPRAELPSRRDGIQHGELMFNGVLWEITRRPRRDLSPGARSLRRDVYVEEPPRCPKCRLGVIETQSWLGYTWSCPACGMRRRSNKSIQAVAEALAHGLH